MKLSKRVTSISRLRALAAAFDGVAWKLKVKGEYFAAIIDEDVANALKSLADIEEAVEAFPKQLPQSLDEWNDFSRNAVAFVRELQTTREVEP